MEAATGTDFGRVHFGEAELGDRRRTERLVKTADAVMCHPGGTLPEKLSDPAGLKALYRLADDSRNDVPSNLGTGTWRKDYIPSEVMLNDPNASLDSTDTPDLDPRLKPCDVIDAAD